MRILILTLLFSTTSFANLNNYPDIWLGVDLCGYSVRNKTVFLKNITAAQEACLLSKKQEVKDLLKAHEDKKTEKKAAKLAIKYYDCNSLTGFDQLVCKAMK